MSVTSSSRPDSHSRWFLPVVAAAGVSAVIAVGVVLMYPSHDTSVRASDVLPPVSPGMADSDYRESHWRLTRVTGQGVTTTIPASVDASLELASNGTVLAFDGVNTINGTFRVTDAGFEIHDDLVTAVGYGGDDPGMLAAESGIGLLMSGPPPAWTISPDASGAAPTPSGGPSTELKASPAYVTVVAATPELLVLHANGIRLDFIRTGPAEQIDKTPIPDSSSARR